MSREKKFDYIFIKEGGENGDADMYMLPLDPTDKLGGPNFETWPFIKVEAREKKEAQKSRLIA